MPRQPTTPRPTRRLKTAKVPVRRTVRRTPARRPARTATDLPPVKLRTPTEEFTLDSELLEQLSLYWSYVVRTRERWASNDSSYDALAVEAQERLREWNVKAVNLDRLADAGIIEVAIPATTDEREWAARTLPWESLLATATRPQRRSGKRQLHVIRHLEVVRRPAERTPKNVLVVESAPGALAEYYSFEAERKLVVASLGLKALAPLRNPTRTELGDRLRMGADVIHLTGIDVHQGYDLLEQRVEAPETDGVYLAGETSPLDAVPADDFAELFGRAGGSAPVLVSCNFYHSAAHIEPALLANGVGAALGFQDQVDDRLAERFYRIFYRAWRQSGWDLLGAFRDALTRISAQAQLRGTGVVLWSARSLLRGRRKRTTTGTSEPERTTETARRLVPGTASADAVRAWFAIDVKPPREVNYSLLHNRERLFDAFIISKLRPGVVEGISVEVQLYVGNESFPYRTTVSLGADVDLVDLAQRIHVPLLSRLLRSNRENVNTCLYVEVKYGNVELHRETYPVTLLAVDEWKFDPKDDSRWLASFVLPRDPAVLRIIAAAQKYVTSLRDEPGAGFDGYQSVDPEADDPDEMIDLQVRAIWSALVNDLPLAYINPPPTFTKDAQRLRTPSDVLNGGRGTCIDLALMFAACLEFIEIYPVVFVLKDHAFPGYWRNGESHDRYLQMKHAGAAADQARAERRQSFDEFDEITQLVNSGDLVPVETVWLTERRSLQEAVDAGLENLINRSDWGALLDVVQARSEGVTPLPLAGGAE
jgi:hypothetical protein